MSLHDRIMDLPKGVFAGDEYTMGYETACETSAMVAKEADELMAEMAKALRIAARSDDPEIKPGARSAVFKYNAWKESAK